METKGKTQENHLLFSQARLDYSAKSITQENTKHSGRTPHA